MNPDRRADIEAEWSEAKAARGIVVLIVVLAVSFLFCIGMALAVPGSMN